MRTLYPDLTADEWPTMVECPRCKGRRHPQFERRLWEGTCWLCEDLGFVRLEDAAEFFRMVREEESHV
jgi:hypothetical protein